MCVPTVLVAGPYRMYFYSHQPNEPPHMHVDRDDQSAKFWLVPVALAATSGSARQNFGASTGWLLRILRCYRKNGMNAFRPNPGERVKDLHFTDDTFAVDLADGRTIVVPLVWYPRLLSATMHQRSRWQVAGAGYGIHWPGLGEDLSTEGLLRGAPAASEAAHLRH